MYARLKLGLNEKSVGVALPPLLIKLTAVLPVLVGVPVILYTPRVVPDPVFDCSDIIGKVFDDRNANGYQDEGEPGLKGVRVVTVRGHLVTTDAEGRYHIACADIPQQDIGSNFVLKLDERSLPSGYRITTDNPASERVTRGKVVKLNFGATIHRVVRVDLAPAVFNDNNEVKPDFNEQLDGFMSILKERPSVLRLGYAPNKPSHEGR